MTDNFNICCGRVYQNNNRKNRESNVSMESNLKIRPFLTDLVLYIFSFSVQEHWDT